jgi:hypothetical protein
VYHEKKNLDHGKLSYNNLTSNFHHITQTSFRKLATTLLEAEKQVYIAPSYASVLCRKGLEEWIRWLFENDPDQTWKNHTTLP